MNQEPTITLRPLSEVFGVEVLGVDLHLPVSAATVRVLNAALDEHTILLFRDQDLNEADQLGLADLFGGLSLRSRPDHKRAEDNPYAEKIGLVTNIRKNGKPIGSLPDGELWFHHDGSFVELPYRATLLYAVEVPEDGGHTLFANMYQAYDDLTDEMKQRLKGLTCLNIFDHRSTASPADPDQDLSAVRHARHPAVVRHPNNGRAALYVSPLLTARIEGLAREESEQLLAELFKYTENQKIIYEHVWRPGDLVIWDNWGSTHARTDFPAEQTRLLRRSIVKGQALEAVL
jgi:taurine dioxygenase